MSDCTETIDYAMPENWMVRTAGNDPHALRISDPVVSYGRFAVDKTRSRIRFEGETEKAVTIVIEPLEL